MGGVVVAEAGGEGGGSIQRERGGREEGSRR